MSVKVDTSLRLTSSSSPFQGSSKEKVVETISNTPKNVISHIKLVQKVYDVAVDQINEYKSEINKLRLEIEHLKITVNRGGEEIERILTPYIESITHEQSLAIAANKEENLQLQNQITEVKKECTQIQYLILAANQTLEKLEGEVGSYK